MDKHAMAERFGKLAVTEGKFSDADLERECTSARLLARPWNTWADFARGIETAMRRRNQERQ